MLRIWLDRNMQISHSTSLSKQQPFFFFLLNTKWISCTATCTNTHNTNARYRPTTTMSPMHKRTDSSSEETPAIWPWSKCTRHDDRLITYNGHPIHSIFSASISSITEWTYGPPQTQHGRHLSLNRRFRLFACDGALMQRTLCVWQN